MNCNIIIVFLVVTIIIVYHAQDTCSRVNRSRLKRDTQHLQPPTVDDAHETTTQRRKRRPRQSSIRPAHRPRNGKHIISATPNNRTANANIQQKSTTTTPAAPAKPRINDWSPRVGSFSINVSVPPPPSRYDFVKTNYGDLVIKYSQDGTTFMCKCGLQVDLANNNYIQNLRNHFASAQCIRRRRGRRSITQFFKQSADASPRFQIPDPRTYCLGLWNKTVLIRGVKCDTKLLGEYACRHLYYISGRVCEVTNGTKESILITRSIHSSNCVGHCIDEDRRIRAGNSCSECQGLLRNAHFREILLQVRG